MVERFVCEEEVFVVDAVLYREPVKLDENRGDVVRRFGAGDDPVMILELLLNAFISLKYAQLPKPFMSHSSGTYNVERDLFSHCSCSRAVGGNVTHHLYSF